MFVFPVLLSFLKDSFMQTNEYMQLKFSVFVPCLVYYYYYCKNNTYLLYAAESFLWSYRFSASQEIPRVLGNLKVHCRIHKYPLPVPTLSHIDPVHTPTSYFIKIRLNIIPHLHLGLPCGLLPQDFPTKTLYTPLLSPIVLHALSISFFSILSPEQYSVRNTDHSAPNYATSSTPLLPRPS
jgi:hypothetical protein